MFKKTILLSIFSASLLLTNVNAQEKDNSPKIGAIIVNGNTYTDKETILRQMGIEVGDTYNTQTFLSFQNKLKSTKWFDKVNVQKEFIDSDNVVINVFVEEAATTKLKVIAGYDSYEKFVGKVEVSDTNLLGKGISGSVYGKYSDKEQTYGVKLGGALGNGYTAGINLYKSKEFIDSIDNTFGDLENSNTGLSVGVTKVMSQNLTLGTNYQIEKQEVEYGNTMYNDDYLTSSVTPFLKYSTLDNPLFPRNGYEIDTSMKIAGLGGDVEYMQPKFNMKYYRSLFPYLNHDVRFKTKLNHNMIIDNGVIPNGKSIYLGGNGSLRGVEQFSIGPKDPTNPIKSSFATSLELDTSIMEMDNVRVGVFYDYLRYGYNDYCSNQKSSAGIAMKYYFKNIPIEVNYAKLLEEKETDKVQEVSFKVGLDF